MELISLKIAGSDRNSAGKIAFEVGKVEEDEAYVFSSLIVPV